MSGRRIGRGTSAVLLVTLLLANTAALWGQGGWGLSHIAPNIVPAEWAPATVNTLSLAIAICFALAVEGIGVFLALSADEADELGLPSGGLRFASLAYGVLVSGLLNLSHWGLNPAGYAFFAFSAISPFLWGVRARIRRGRKVAPSRRLWHPKRSISLIREMAWLGLADEDEALSLRVPAVEPAPTPAPAPVAIEPAPAPVRRERKAASSGRTSLAVSMLLDGTPVKDVVARTGMSEGAVRKHAAAIRVLRADIDDDRKFDISSSAVETIRLALRGVI